MDELLQNHFLEETLFLLIKGCGVPLFHIQKLQRLTESCLTFLSLQLSYSFSKVVLDQALFELFFFLKGEARPNIVHLKTLQKISNLLLLKKRSFQKIPERDLLRSFFFFFVVYHCSNPSTASFSFLSIFFDFFFSKQTGTPTSYG